MVHNESFLIHSNDPMWHRFLPFKSWLVAHAALGACTFVIVPMQFSERLRLRYRKLHRVSGRIYVATAFVAAPLGIYMKCLEEGLGASPRSFTAAAATHGLLWMLTTGVAFALILKGKVQQHRQWMTRSVVVGPLAFLAPRAVLGLTGWEHAGRVVVEAVVWACIALSIPLADVVLQLQELSRSRPTSIKVQAAAQ